MVMFFYDQQIRRFLNQIIAVFSNFHVEFGTDNDGNTIYHRVPVRYATLERMSASILKENSENVMQSVPIMAVYITGLEYERDRVQNPTYVDKIHIRQNRLNTAAGENNLLPGNAFTVERLMPVPYKLNFNVDIWTSSTEQKLQLLEQLLVLFNPAFEIQSTDNYLDWTSLSYIHQDGVSYSSRSVPIGTDDSIDVATLNFYCPIWLGPPAKLKKLGVVETIVASIYDAAGNLDSSLIEGMGNLLSRQYITPTGYNLIVLNGQATLYPAAGPLDTSQSVPAYNGEAISWHSYVAQMGQLKNGITQLRLRKNNPNTVREIVGTVSFHPNDPAVLLFNVDQDTVPTNTLPPVDAIIDPFRSAPGINGLPAAAAGQRYLLLEPINPGKASSSNYDGAIAWKNGSMDFVANEFDIIEYDGNQWIVSWNAASSNRDEYVTNLTTGLQYHWDRESWSRSWEGEYLSGEWSLVF